MNTIKATWQNGQIVPDGPVEWSEGSRLLIHEERPTEVDFMSEADQGDDLESIEKWIAELRAMPPVTITAEQETWDVNTARLDRDCSKFA